MKSRGNAVIAALLLTVAMPCALNSHAQPQIRPSQPAADKISNDLRTVASLIRVGEFQRALSFLDNMRKLYGDEPRIINYYKQVYRESKMYPELEKVTRDQLSRDRANPILLAELGEARYLQKDQNAADSLLNLALVTGKPSEFTYRSVADIKMRYGLYDDAIGIFLKGRKSLSSPALFSLELASIYETQHDYPRAADEYILQLQQSPEQTDFVLTKIRGLLEDDDNPDEIIGAVRKNMEQSPSRTDLYEVLGDLYIKQNQMDKALECYKSIGSKQNDDGQSLVRFAERCFDSKAYVTAVNAVDEYFRTTKKASLKDMALLIKAESQQASGSVNEALEGFKYLSTNSADQRIRAEASFSQGVIYAEDKNNCDSALMVWDSLLKAARDPGLANRTRVEMAICHLRMNENTQAETLLARVANDKLQDDNAERAMFLLGDLALYAGNQQRADSILKSLVWQYPQGSYSNDALMRLDVLSLLGDEETGEVLLVKFGEAMKAQVLSRPLEAATILADSVFANSPLAEQAAFYSATDFAKAGQAQDATGRFKNYIERFPDGLYVDRAYLGLGDTYMRDPVTYPEAKSAYNKILEAFPSSPTTELARDRLRQLESLRKIG